MPLKKQFKFDYIKPGLKLEYELILHDLTIADNLSSPFEDSYNHQYLTLRKLETTSEEITKFFFTLGETIVIESRNRFTFWDLAGDVGGFYEALSFICELLTGVYAAIAFKTNFLDQNYFDS